MDSIFRLLYYSEQFPKNTAMNYTMLTLCHHLDKVPELAIDEIAELCSRVIVMDGGRVVMDGAPHDVFTKQNAAELRRINLGVPRATKFSLELAERGLDIGEGVLDESELVRRLATILRPSA